MKASLRILLFLLALGGFTTPASALTNVLVNGGFESPAVSGYKTVNSPSSFSGWTVATGGVDIVAHNFYAPASGLQSLDLNSVASGSVFQNVATIPGHSYLLTFAFAANPLPDDPSFPAPAVKRMEARWGTTLLGTFMHDVTGRTGSNVGWHDFAFGVVGTGADRLTFTSLTGGSAGPAIDSVSVAEVPEPPAVLLLALAVIAGSAAFGRRARVW